MATPRRDPWIHVTWLTGLLSGDKHCAWAPWFKAHWKFDKLERDFDLSAWKAAHTDMVLARARELEADGWLVFLEDQNDFKLKGQTGIVLSGKCDIVAVRGNEALVVDCKSGQQRDSDFFQVLIYLLALPLLASAPRPSPMGLAVHQKTIAGEVQYKAARVGIAPEAFTPALRARILEAIKQAGGETAPARVPSAAECRWCDVGPADCPSRIDEAELVTATTEF